MKHALIAVAVVAALGLTACSSNPKNPGFAQPEDTKTPVKDARIATDFRDQGLRLHYTLMGNLERIEVFGVAPAWQGNHTIRAEMDAKEKLLKFVHGESMTSDTKTRILSKTLDRAKDQTLNRFETNSDFQFDAKEIEKEFNNNEGAQPDNTSRRTADRIENTMLQKTQTLVSSGRLTGLHKVGDSVSKDGRYYIAKYEWSERNQATADTLRARMK
jgi:hypothetical protein